MFGAIFIFLIFNPLASVSEGKDLLQAVPHLDKERTTSQCQQAISPEAYSDATQTSISDIWTGPDLFTWHGGSQIPPMSVVTCKLIFLVGLAMAAETEVSVEFGTWIGPSTSCLAAGLKTAGIPRRLHCYDLFEMTVNAHKQNGTYWHGWSTKDGKRVGTGAGGIPPLLPLSISIVHGTFWFIGARSGSLQLR